MQEFNVRSPDDERSRLNLPHDVDRRQHENWEMNKPNWKTSKTRKRAIAKALQLKGHSDFAPVDLAYQNFLDFLFENIAFWEVPRGNHKCRSRGAMPLSTINKQEIRTDFAVNLRCLLHTLWPWPLTLWPWTNVLAVMCWNSVLNFSDIDQCTPEL